MCERVEECGLMQVARYRDANITEIGASPGKCALPNERSATHKVENPYATGSNRKWRCQQTECQPCERRCGELLKGQDVPRTFFLDAPRGGTNRRQPQRPASATPATQCEAGCPRSQRVIELRSDKELNSADRTLDNVWTAWRGPENDGMAVTVGHGRTPVGDVRDDRILRSPVPGRRRH